MKKSLPFAEVAAHFGDLCLITNGKHPSLCFVEDSSDSSFFKWDGNIVESGDVIIPINFLRTKVKCITKNGIFYISRRVGVKKVR